MHRVRPGPLEQGSSRSVPQQDADVAHAILARIGADTVGTHRAPL
jgi:hypothetical protein